MKFKTAFSTSFFIIIFSYSVIFCQSSGRFSVKDFGAKGDGVALDTKSIQSAIDKCSEAGGTVVFTSGKYLTGSLELKSNVNIFIGGGAVILGSTNINDYTGHTPALKSYNDVFLKHSLFYAERVKNISISGDGIIDGQGGSFKVMTKVKPDRYRNRPYIIRFVECDNVKVENITMRNSAMWMQQYLACRDLFIHGIRVYNHANQNNDMMDIDGCSNVIISDCVGDTDDDGITLKSTSPRITENVVISNCVISSHCNAFKLGTESTGGFRNISISNLVIKPSDSKTKIYGFDAGICGINLSAVDGGILEGITISNIRIDGPQVPIYLRLGNRGRKYSEDAPAPGVGTYKNVMISNVTATNVGPVGCSITGIPGHYVNDISIDNIKIVFSGKGTKEDADKIPAELEDQYPEATMWGNLPAYGFFIRHAKNISLGNVDVSFENSDVRPAVICSDVDGLKISGLTAECGENSASLISLIDVKNAWINNSSPSSSTGLFVKISGPESGGVKLTGNDFRLVKEIFNQKAKSLVKMEGNVR